MVLHCFFLQHNFFKFCEVFNMVGTGELDLTNTDVSGQKDFQRKAECRQKKYN
jgi:hypothetical protein